MHRYKNILFATDLSKSNKKAAKETLSIVSDCSEAKLRIIHVVHVPAIYSIGFISYEEMEKRLLSEARPLAQDFIQEAGFQDYELILVIGSPKEEILKIVKKHNIDLLIIGSHGEYGISDTIGSTVNAVIQRAECNVLIARG